MIDVSICDWYGIICSGGNNLFSIVLPQNGLKGAFPILESDHMIKLIIPDNHIYFFPDLAMLPRLAYLDLSNNSMTGPVLPSLFKTSRYSVAANDNYLDALPLEEDMLYVPVSLSLRGNRFSGTIPSTLCSFLYISYCSGKGIWFTVG